MARLWRGFRTDKLQSPAKIRQNPAITNDDIVRFMTCKKLPKQA